MWFMNKIINPVVRLILRSPFHGLLSGAVLLITYRGRKSGKEYTLPVQHVQVDQVVYIVPGAPEKKTWWRNLLGGSAVTLTLKGKSLKGSALVLKGNVEAATDPLCHYFRRFPPSAKLHGVRLESDGSCNAQDLQKAAQSIFVVKVELGD